MDNPQSAADDTKCVYHDNAVPETPVRKSSHELAQSRSRFLVTPQRPMVNSGKKRTAPDLSRRTPGFSHHCSISTIFEDAAQTLRSLPTPRPLSANARRTRMPLSRVDGDRNRVTSSIDIKYGGTKPPSSGFGSPTARDTTMDSTPSSDQDTVDRLLYPDLAHLIPSPSLPRPVAEPNLGASGDRPSSPVPGVQSWLEDIASSYPSEANVQSDYTSPTRFQKRFSPSRISGTPKRGLRTGIQSPTSTRSSRLSPSRVSHLPTPCGHLTDPPKRKGLHLSPPKTRTPTHWGQDFTIYEDQTSDQLAELSPSVEKYRKGRRPKRDRCVSYWDKDILPEPNNVPGEAYKENDERQVLGDLPALTTAKVFMEGVENAQFDFEVCSDEGGFHGNVILWRSTPDGGEVAKKGSGSAGKGRKGNCHESESSQG
ncbi:MAG: hypothetical protein Q9181_004619 [Wetmoreana brouardii]